MQFDLRVDITKAKTDACAKIDTAAEACRLKWITPGAGQAAVYLQKKQQADDFIAKYPDATSAAAAQNADWPFLAAELGVTANTLFDVATSIRATAAQWVSVAAQIEQLRLNGKQNANKATTISGIDAATNITWPVPS